LPERSERNLLMATGETPAGGAEADIFGGRAAPLDSRLRYILRRMQRRKACRR
jgi:hypothetical protein